MTTYAEAFARLNTLRQFASNRAIDAETDAKERFWDEVADTIMAEMEAIKLLTLAQRSQAYAPITQNMRQASEGLDAIRTATATAQQVAKALAAIAAAI